MDLKPLKAQIIFHSIKNTQKYNAYAQSIVHSSNVQHLSAKTLYICDLQYTRNKMITKDWIYDEINPQAKHYKKIFHCNDTTRKL